MTFEERKAEEWLQGIEGDDCVIITDREERKQAYIAGYREALKMKINTTTISDAPLMEREQLAEAKDIINCLVHLGEFNENTDEEYLNYQVHDVLKKAELFLKEWAIQEDKLCEYCDQYESCPDGKRCRTCDNGSKWKRR